MEPKETGEGKREDLLRDDTGWLDIPEELRRPWDDVIADKKRRGEKKKEEEPVDELKEDPKDLEHAKKKIEYAKKELARRDDEIAGLRETNSYLVERNSEITDAARRNQSTLAAVENTLGGLEDEIVGLTQGMSTVWDGASRIFLKAYSVTHNLEGAGDYFRGPKQNYAPYFIAAAWIGYALLAVVAIPYAVTSVYSTAALISVGVVLAGVTLWLWRSTRSRSRSIVG